MNGVLTNDVRNVCALLPRSLRLLEISFVGLDSEEDEASLLQLLPSRFPSLSTIKLWGYPGTGAERVYTELGAMLSRFRELKYVFLNGPSFTENIARALSELPLLTTLEFVSSYRPRPFQWVPTANIFPVLSKMDVHLDLGKTTRVLLLDIATSRSLQHLVITHGKAFHPTAELGSIISVIVQHTQLRQLSLKRVAVRAFDRYIVQQVGGCGTLEKLELEIQATEGSVEVTDEDVGRMLEGLGRLTTFRFHLAKKQKPVITLQTLVLALQNCPRVEHVSPFVDATSSKILEPIAYRPHQHLRSLDFVTGPSISHIGSPEEVAAFLSPMSICTVGVERPRLGSDAAMG
ncbi:hypothetical protein FRB94_009277 [Tulasnella sp. JGI-2019a]|nr:hypothetical protein FRB94_009277 [Tulasnella sp. JGI-2019a]KAG9000136.1 hypothetical protein FRB93_012811 [Tulasnella sp. JGI-2019a]KAG9026483.1 hypothetical protein FRB95_008822 [Tulasnella sp. JGI-2019a]